MEYLRENDMIMNVDVLDWKYNIIETIKCEYGAIEKTLSDKGYKFIELVESDDATSSIFNIGAKVQ